MATGSGEDIRGFVKEAVKENNDKLLANINSMISKISAKPSAVSLLDAPRFKRKSNKEQFKCNSKLIERLDDVQTSIQANDLASANHCLDEGTINLYLIFSLS